LNVDALSINPVNLSKKDDDFGWDVMESKDKLLSMSDRSPNDVVINLFILQFMDRETGEIKEHQVEVETEKKNMGFTLEEEMHQMTPKDYQRMVIKA
jgi:hypothetical protein